MTVISRVTLTLLKLSWTLLLSFKATFKRESCDPLPSFRHLSSLPLWIVTGFINYSNLERDSDYKERREMANQWTSGFLERGLGSTLICRHVCFHAVLAASCEGPRRPLICLAPPSMLLCVLRCRDSPAHMTLLWAAGGLAVGLCILAAVIGYCDGLMWDWSHGNVIIQLVHSLCNVMNLF